MFHRWAQSVEFYVTKSDRYLIWTVRTGQNRSFRIQWTPRPCTITSTRTLTIHRWRFRTWTAPILFHTYRTTLNRRYRTSSCYSLTCRPTLWLACRVHGHHHTQSAISSVSTSDRPRYKEWTIQPWHMRYKLRHHINRRISISPIKCLMLVTNSIRPIRQQTATIQLTMATTISRRRQTWQVRALAAWAPCPVLTRRCQVLQQLPDYE